MTSLLSLTNVSVQETLWTASRGASRQGQKYRWELARVVRSTNLRVAV